MHEENNGQTSQMKKKPEHVFTRFPSALIRNQRLSPECLALVAYRSTFKDDKSSWGLWEDVLSATPILGEGFGENVRARAIAEAAS